MNHWKETAEILARFAELSAGKRQAHLDRETVEQTLGCIIKDHHDLRQLAEGDLETVLAEAIPVESEAAAG